MSILRRLFGRRDTRKRECYDCRYYDWVSARVQWCLKDEKPKGAPFLWPSPFGDQRCAEHEFADEDDGGGR